MSSTTTIELESIAAPTTGAVTPVSRNDDGHSLMSMPAPRNAQLSSAAPSKSSAVLTIAQLTVITSMSSIITGLITVGIPQIAKDLELPASLIYWPILSYTLALGSCQLLAGAVADVLGNRLINIIGSFSLGIFILACGLARTGIELIMFRAIQGVAVALYFPTTLSILSSNLPSGRIRNVGFSCFGFSQVIGFAIGLVLGGVLISTAGWRAGFYICGALTLSLSILGLWAVPADRERPNVQSSVAKRLATDVDWIGAIIASASVGMLAYVLGMITTSSSNIKKPFLIVLVVLGIALIPVFALWINRQEKLSRPALIPNSLWSNKPFTSVCVMVLLSSAVMQTMELLSSLFFQEVQQLNALQSSLRFLPSLILGGVLELATGLLVDKLPATYLVPISSIIGAGSPLLMAFVKPQWSYWHDAFISQLLEPLTVDVLYTVGILIISQEFSESTQALAGAVFSTVGQFGQSFGLALVAVISSSVSQNQSKYPQGSPEGLLIGYQAGFWASFSWMILASLVGFWGLRKVGKVGLKKD